ncbi:MAG: sodium:solute symporter [Alistipes sp.]|nr:sodium:solute symporter [Alistipes sp.]
MKPQILTLVVAAAYILLLFVVSHLSGSDRNATAKSRHPRWLVTLAMVGAAVTGITFVSLPGSVEQDAFSYLQMNLGFIVAYVVIAYWLIPIYYRHNVTSLYEYLDERFGTISQTTGAWFFLVAKMLGAALRVFVVCLVLQQLLCAPLHIPFWITVTVFMALAWLYTHRGGVSSIIWADLIKTICMVACVVLSILFVLRSLDISFVEAMKQGSQQGLTQIFFFDDINSSRHFLKLFISGIFIVIASTGLDQDLMQRILSSDSVRSAQRNMVLSSFIQVAFLALMLMMGAIFFLYTRKNNLPSPTADEMFAFVASQKDMPMLMGTLIVLGVVASTFSSVGGSLTALTTSFMVDILHGRKRFEEKHYLKIHHFVHFIMAALMILTIFAFAAWGDGCSINLYFKMSSYTFGPLLGMFAFGALSKRRVCDKWVPLVAILSPALCAPLDYYSEQLFAGYQFGFEILLLNAALTIIGLWLVSVPNKKINFVEN